MAMSVRNHGMGPSSSYVDDMDVCNTLKTERRESSSDSINNKTTHNKYHIATYVKLHHTLVEQQQKVCEKKVFE